MANRYFYWTGNGAGTKTNWCDGRNWNDGAGSPYAEDNYPSSSAEDTDYVYFNAPLASGASSPETNVDLSAKNPIAALTVTSDYDGHIATAAQFLKVKIPTGDLIFDGSGSAENSYIFGEATSKIAKIKLLGGSVYLAGKIVSLEALRAIINIENATTIETSMLVGYLTAQTGDVVLTIGSGCTLPSSVIVTGGNTTCNSAVTTLDIRGGTWIQNGAITTANVTTGTLDWRSGTITTANIYSGTVTAASSNIARTITKAVLYPNGTLNLNNRQNNIAVGDYIQTYGGSLILGSGQKVTLV